MRKTAVELLQDWGTLAASQGKKRAIECRTVVDEDGTITHWAECENGRHWSKESQEDALEELIDAHTPGVEDRAETRARLEALGVPERQASALLKQIAQTIKLANKKMPRAERDDLVLIEVAAAEAQIQAAREADERVRVANEAKTKADTKVRMEAEAARAAEDRALRDQVAALTAKVAELEKA